MKEREMYERILLALDLEGMNNVVGEPYTGLSQGSDAWEVARHQAVKEINAAAEVLFEMGARKVGLWDNHGGGGNVDPSELDSRIILIKHDNSLPRMNFAAGEYDCICFFGYHTMEGTLGGVLAHTMNSKMVQFYKLNGEYIGEVDMDAYIAASHGMPSCFYVGGDIACAQARHAVPDIVTVVTKHEISRNEAEYRDNGELLSEIREKIAEAVTSEHKAKECRFPAVWEKSFKRVEDAAVYYKKMRELGMESEYLSDPILGKDAHTVVTRLYSIEDLKKSI